MKNTKIYKICHCFIAWNANTSKSVLSKFKRVYHPSWQCLSQASVVIYSGEILFLVLPLDTDEEIELMKALCVNLCPNLAMLEGNANQNQ